jgi:hypothetical protein
MFYLSSRIVVILVKDLVLGLAFEDEKPFEKKGRARFGNCGRIVLTSKKTASNSRLLSIVVLFILFLFLVMASTTSLLLQQ